MEPAAQAPAASKHLAQQLRDYSEQLRAVDLQLMAPHSAVKLTDAVQNFALGYGSALYAARSGGPRAPDWRAPDPADFPALLALQLQHEMAVQLAKLLDERDEKAARCCALELALAALARLDLHGCSRRLEADTRLNLQTAYSHAPPRPA